MLAKKHARSALCNPDASLKILSPATRPLDPARGRQLATIRTRTAGCQRGAAASVPTTAALPDAVLVTSPRNSSHCRASRSGRLRKSEMKNA